MKTKKILLKKLISLATARASGSFTIEAAVIVPIAMILVVWLINTSISIRGKVMRDASVIETVFRTAPGIIEEEGSLSELDPVLSSSSISIDLDMLDGRQVLLKYMLIKRGYLLLSGGLSDED